MKRKKPERDARIAELERQLEVARAEIDSLQRALAGVMRQQWQQPYKVMPLPQYPWTPVWYTSTFCG